MVWRKEQIIYFFEEIATKLLTTCKSFAGKDLTDSTKGAKYKLSSSLDCHHSALRFYTNSVQHDFATSTSIKKFKLKAPHPTLYRHKHQLIDTLIQGITY